MGTRLHNPQPRRPRRWRAIDVIIVAASGTALVLVIINIVLLIFYSCPDPYLQSSFPCTEDEVLGYAPRFGPDRVGCIHRENLGGE